VENGLRNLIENEEGSQTQCGGVGGVENKFLISGGGKM